MKKRIRAAIDKVLRDISRKSDIEQLRQDIGNFRVSVEDAERKNAEKALSTEADVRSLLVDNQRRSLKAFIHRDRSLPAIILLGTHDYGNIGDLAINYCERVFLNDHFSSYPMYVFSRRTLLSNWQLISGAVTPGDILFIHGGGNMGDIWLNEERARRKIIESFPENKIISLPQTIKFYDEKELDISKSIYNGHKNLLILVRDDVSLKFAEENFKKVAIYRTEDIVLNYRFVAPERIENDNILFLERNDREKGSDDLTTIRRTVEKLGYANYTSDTVVEGLTAPTDGMESTLVYDKIDEIHAARVVVTNRLHGALFSLLAGRPVVVVDNNYGKVAGALKNIAEKAKGRIVFAEPGAKNVTTELLEKLYRVEDEGNALDSLRASVANKLKERISDFIR